MDKGTRKGNFSGRRRLQCFARGVASLESLESEDPTLDRQVGESLVSDLREEAL